MTSQQITISYFSSKLTECPSSLKPYKVVDFANKLESYEVVRKKFGDVKKISLFERSEFEIFSRRAFCVLMGRAPARSLGVLRGGMEGIRANRNALSPLHKKN